jgi:tRNA(Ile)-lysidine synthase
MEVMLPKNGKYVVAVSGGVDSVSLLHALKDLSGVDIVVAHFDHGIRQDSRADREFVQKLAGEYDLPFVYDEGRLGAAAGEAQARAARYEFLREVLKDTCSEAIVTAHHRDDVLETAVINLLRGSGRKGLTALGSNAGIERPLLGVPKSEVIAYAQKHGLQWREDSTNQDVDYLRNYVRHRMLPRFDETARGRLREIISGLRGTNDEIDSLLMSQLSMQPAAAKLNRDWFIQLPHAVARETMAAWLRNNSLRDFDSKTLERLVVAAKTAAPGKTFDVLRGATLAISTHDLALTGAER